MLVGVSGFPYAGENLSYRACIFWSSLPYTVPCVSSLLLQKPEIIRTSAYHTGQIPEQGSLMNTVMLHRFPPDLRTYSAKITRISAATSRIFAYQAHRFYHALRKIAILFSKFFTLFLVKKRDFRGHRFVHLSQIGANTPFLPLKKHPADAFRMHIRRVLPHIRVILLCKVSFSGHQTAIE